MSLLRGEEINIGVGLENPSARGVNVPAQKWIPGRTPTGINVEVIKTLLKETKASAISSQGSEIVQRKASGPIEFNLRSNLIGYLLKSLLGECDTNPADGSPTVKDHAFTVLKGNPQFPTLTLSLAQTGMKSYEYPGALVSGLEIKFPVDDLINATAEFVAMDEEESVGELEPTWDDEEHLLRPFEAEIKIADSLSDLATATAINVKDLTLSIKNGGKAQQHIGSITPTDNIAGLISVGGKLVLDYEGETYHDIFRDGDYKAMQIKIERSDVEIGTGLHPTITIQLAKVSLEGSSPDRPIDDIAKDSFDFVAHYSEVDEEAINIVVRNEVAEYNYDVADYNYDEESGS